MAKLTLQIAKWRTKKVLLERNKTVFPVEAKAALVIARKIVFYKGIAAEAKLAIVRAMWRLKIVFLGRERTLDPTGIAAEAKAALEMAMWSTDNVFLARKNKETAIILNSPHSLGMKTNVAGLYCLPKIISRDPNFRQVGFFPQCG